MLPNSRCNSGRLSSKLALQSRGHFVESNKIVDLYKLESILVNIIPHIQILMIDIEKLKPGNEVWVLHNNRTKKLVIKSLEKIILASGVQYNIIDKDFFTTRPACLCYSSEMDLIEEQINYWHDMRLNKIVKDNA